jgi:beta-xylosidase
MVSFDGPPVQFPIKEFREGIVVFKRKGVYYFMWSVDDARSDDYRVAYGMSKSPFGPVEIPKDNVVIRKNGLVKGTGHNSVVNVPGTDRWYTAYHRHAIPDGSGFKRETCLAELKFRRDGTILPVNVLSSVRRPEPVRHPRKD